MRLLHLNKSEGAALGTFDLDKISFVGPVASVKGDEYEILIVCDGQQLPLRGLVSQEAFIIRKAIIGALSPSP